MVNSAIPSRPKLFYGHFIVLIGFLTMVVSWGTIHTFGVFLKPLTVELGWTRTLASGAYSLLIIVHGFFYILTGRLNDKFGPRLVLTGSGLLSGIGYLFMSRMAYEWQLYLALGIILGLAQSAVFVPLASTVSRWFTNRRGIMTAIVTAGSGFGTLVLTPIAGQLITQIGWRNSFMLSGIIVFTFITLAAQFLRRNPRQSISESNDIVARYQIQQESGYSLQQAISCRLLWLVCVIFFCHLFGQQMVLVHIVSHATDLGISAAIAAMFLAVVGGVSVLAILLIGSTSDKIGTVPSLILGFSVVSSSLLWLLVAKEIWAFFLFAVVFGLGYGGIVSLEAPIVAELFGLRAHGAILGVVLASAMVGGAIGAFVGGRVFDLTGSYQVAFIISAILSFIGLALASKLKKRKTSYSW